MPVHAKNRYLKNLACKCANLTKLFKPFQRNFENYAFVCWHFHQNFLQQIIKLFHNICLFIPKLHVLIILEAKSILIFMLINLDFDANFQQMSRYCRSSVVNVLKSVTEYARQKASNDSFRRALLRQKRQKRTNRKKVFMRRNASG